MPQDRAGSKALSREPSMEIEYGSTDDIPDPEDSQASSHSEKVGYIYNVWNLYQK